MNTETNSKPQRKRTRALRNLVKRNRIWYFKKSAHGQTSFVSLETEDLELAKAKRDKNLALATANELHKITGARSKSSTLAELFAQYDLTSGLHKTMEGNKSSLLTVLRQGLDQPDLTAEDISLDLITKKLARDYQDKVRTKYETEAGPNEKDRRMARDRANRTTKSTFNQAKSIFTKKHKHHGDLLERFREAGLSIPPCVAEFHATHVAGTMATKVYFPPSDDVIKTTFEKIEELRETKPDLYNLFWLALGTGCRRSEIVDITINDIIELNHHLWIGAGIGKDGKQIQLPIINWPVHPSSTINPEHIVRDAINAAKLAGRQNLFPGENWARHDLLPKELNAWLQSIGWNDEKKMHGLRAYIGSLLFKKNPRLAQRYLRHKNMDTTENHYSHFINMHDILDFHPVVLPAPAVATTEPKAA